MLSPLVLVVFFSFGSNQNATFPVGALTLDWYRVLFKNPEFWVGLKNSLVITVSVGVLSTVIGTCAAMGITKLKSTKANTVISALSLPIMMPPLVLALALVSIYSGLGIRMGVHTVIMSHLVFTQPFVIVIVNAQLANFNFASVDSARDLGASPMRSFFDIVLPNIRPTIIGAALIAMAISLDDFIITFFTIGNGMTLPTLIWGMMRTSLDPSINALGTLVLFATIGFSAIALRITKYQS